MANLHVRPDREIERITVIFSLLSLVRDGLHGRCLEEGRGEREPRGVARVGGRAVHGGV